MMLKSPFADLHAWLIDMDGVIYRGEQALPGAAALIASLQAEGHPFLFLTNNATQTPAQYLDKLARMAIHVQAEQVFTSSLATAAYLRAHFPPPQRALVVGGHGIQTAVRAAGYEVVAQAEAAQLVVTGLDQHLTYAILAEAALAISAGAPWIATNSDRTLPTERGNLPGAGAILAFLTATTGRTPLVIGKPQPGIFLQALDRLGVGADQAVMLGDRLETDILGGQRAGLRTICVLTGIDSQADAEAYDPRPNWIIPDLTALLA